MSGRDDRRSPAAAIYRAWYKTPEWRALRKAQLEKQPLCERHLRRGQRVAASVANHKRPHRGDRALFFSAGNLQSVCKACHDGDVQSEERRGYSDEVGPDGMPIDPRHPFLRAER
jgi:5-methylcytosine-specific restriction endonuclease McrA